MHGLYLLWWVQEKHIPAPIVAVSLAAGDLALMFLEVPTGWFADKYGHRTSLIAGSAVQVLGMLACWLGPGVLGVVTANLLVALGDGFRSGADQALLYRTCVAVDREGDFQSLEARSLAWRAAALLVELLAGGLIVRLWGFDAGWMAETSLCAIGLALACTMIEPPALERLPAAPVRATVSTSRGDVVLSFAALIVPAALVAGGHSATSFLAQTAGGRNAAEVTWLVAALVLSEAIGAAMATRMRRSGARQQIGIGIFAVLTFAIGLAAPPLLVAAAMGLSLLDGLALPMRSAALQRIADDAVRARAASMASACDMALRMITLTLAGFWTRAQK